MKRKLPKNEDELAKVPGEFSAQEAARQLGRRGGISTRDRHGIEFYRRIGARGAETTKRRYSHLFSEFGRKGGRPRRPALNEFVGEEDRNREEAGRPSDPLLPPEL